MKTPQQLLQQTLEVGECLLPDASPGGRTRVPDRARARSAGLGRAATRSTAPCPTGDSRRAMCWVISTACGYDCRAASVGIISSAWDRACELYAELTGGTADYGIAHAQRFGHARFGTAYPERRLCPAGARTGPSISSGTASAARRRGCSCSCSRTAAPRKCRRPRPQARRPRRCSPAAGPAGCTRWWPSPRRTTGRRFSTCSRTRRMRSRRCFSARRARSASRRSRACTTSGSTSSASAATRTSRSRRPRCACWRKTRSRRATTPLTTCVRAGARALNARIDTLPDAWYFSIPCCRTLPRLLTHDQKPDTAMTPLLWPFSTAMGRDGAAPCRRDWLPNDGLVNTDLRPLSRRRAARGLCARTDAGARRVAGAAG